MLYCPYQHCLFSRTLLLVCRIPILIALGIGLVITPRINILIRKNCIAWWCRIKMGNNIQLSVRSLPIKIVQGICRHRTWIIKHRLHKTECFWIRRIGKTNKNNDVIDFPYIIPRFLRRRLLYFYLKLGSLCHYSVKRNTNLHRQTQCHRIGNAYYVIGRSNLSIRRGESIYIPARLRVFHYRITQRVVQPIIKLISAGEAMQNASIGLLYRLRNIDQISRVTSCKGKR
jgi:hypothetical protein